MKLPLCLLVDNGSLQPEAIFSLRMVAKNLTSLTPFSVVPLGLLHSNKIEPNQLGGEPGGTISTFLSSELGEAEDELLILPFFLGPSRGVTGWLMEKLEGWRTEKKGRSYRVLNCLHENGEDRLTKALYDEINKICKSKGLINPSVAMVDHGTPVKEVNRVRENVGLSLHGLLSGGVSKFSTCSMERREGEKYAFNDPLLEQVLNQWGLDGCGEVVVALFFLMSGRHAGEGGDLARICQSAEEKFPKMKIFRTQPLGGNQLVLSILKDKLESIKNVYDL
mgnify:FL=1